MSPGVQYLTPDEPDEEPVEEPVSEAEEAEIEEGAENPEEVTDEQKAAEEAAAAARARLAAIVAHVRSESRETRLTDPEVFLGERFGYSEEQLEQAWVDMSEDEQYQDIVFTRDARTGIEYLHSDVVLSPQYATLMLRTKSNDPVYLIAETVREYSEVYPRPTRYDLFEWPPFSLSEDQVLEAVETMQADPEYSDVKPLVACNGVKYLYSDRYMRAKQAQRSADNNEMADSL